MTPRAEENDSLDLDKAGPRTNSPEITYAHDGAVTAEEFQSVLRSSGLGSIRPVEDAARLKRMIDNANLIVTARLPQDGSKLVGIARGTTDFSWFCYLSDLAVAEEAKGLGIGRGLLAHARHVLGPEVSLILASVPDAVSFYERAGMEPLPNCFWNRREQ